MRTLTTDDRRVSHRRVALLAIAVALAARTTSASAQPRKEPRGARRTGALAKTEDTIAGGTHWRMMTDGGAAA